ASSSGVAWGGVGSSILHPEAQAVRMENRFNDSMFESQAQSSLLSRSQSVPQVGPLSTFARAGGACIYLSSNSTYGSRFPTGLPRSKFGLNGRFTDAIQKSSVGISANGPDTKVAPLCRYMHGTSDWTNRMG
ncbi:unnamed protein product, partial [Polarella glacialis]